jgi:hypothetical protein
MTQAPWQQAPAPQGYPQQQAPQGYVGPPQGQPTAPQGQQPWQQAPVPVPQGPANGYQPTAQPWQQAPQAPPAAAPQQQAQPQEEGDDEFFTSGTGGSYMSFSDDACVGHPRGGEIVGINEQQQTDKDTKEPMFWPNSDRKIMIKVVTMQTGERRPGDQEDTGLRSVWLPQSKDITKAVIEAIKQSSPNELRLKIGGQLWITRTGSRPTTQKNGGRGFPAFTYTAQYIPPQGNPHDTFFGGAPAPQGAPAQPAPQQYGQPAQAAPTGQQAPWQQQQQQQAAPVQQGNPYAAQQPAQAAPNGQPAGPANGQAPWAQAPAPQGQAPNGWQQAPAPQGQAPNGYLQQVPAPQGQAPWAQPGVPQGVPPQGTYQPSAPDPANPWGNQPQQQPGPNPYPQQ